jgi:hypothetical protein
VASVCPIVVLKDTKPELPEELVVEVVAPPASDESVAAAASGGASSSSSSSSAVDNNAPSMDVDGDAPPPKSFEFDESKED